MGIRHLQENKGFICRGKRSYGKPLHERLKLAAQIVLMMNSTNSVHHSESKATKVHKGSGGVAYTTRNGRDVRACLVEKDHVVLDFELVVGSYVCSCQNNAHEKRLC